MDLFELGNTWALVSESWHVHSVPLPSSLPAEREDLGAGNGHMAMVIHDKIFFTLPVSPYYDLL